MRQFLDLDRGADRVDRVGVGHRLHAHRRVAADRDHARAPDDARLARAPRPRARPARSAGRVRASLMLHLEARDVVARDRRQVERLAAHLHLGGAGAADRDRQRQRAATRRRSRPPPAARSNATAPPASVTCDPGRRSASNTTMPATSRLRPRQQTAGTAAPWNAGTARRHDGLAPARMPVRHWQARPPGRAAGAEARPARCQRRLQPRACRPGRRARRRAGCAASAGLLCGNRVGSCDSGQQKTAPARRPAAAPRRPPRAATAGPPSRGEAASLGERNGVLMPSLSCTSRGAAERAAGAPAPARIDLEGAADAGGQRAREHRVGQQVDSGRPPAPPACAPAPSAMAASAPTCRPAPRAPGAAARRPLIASAVFRLGIHRLAGLTPHSSNAPRSIGATFARLREALAQLLAELAHGHRDRSCGARP